MRTTCHKGLLITLALASSGCGAKAPEAPDTVAPAAEDVATDDVPSFADVPHSEPPPRPPPPAGITILRRDAVTLALSGSGKFLAAGDLAGQALLWDLERGRFLWTDPTPEGNRLGRVVFAAAAPVYLGGSFHEPDRPWRVWSADSLERRGELGESGWIGLDAALDDQASRALTLSSSRDGAQQRLELWDLTTLKATAPANAPPANAAAVDAKPLTTLPITGVSRGAVAIDAAGARFALADDGGGVSVLTLAPDANVSPTAAIAKAPVEVFKAQSEAGTREESRVSKLALAADGMTLYGAVGARLVTWPLAADAKTSSLVIGAADDPLPIRGLHRVTRTDAVTLVVVTRPAEGGLRFYAGDGRLLGTLNTGCRCESHALSADAQVAACGCTEASELRWGRVTSP